MEIDVQVTRRLDREVDQAVARELLQHVVEKADAGRDVAGAAAVEIDGGADRGLARLALDARRPDFFLRFRHTAFYQVAGAAANGRDA